MKYDKGFAPLVVLLIVLGVLAVGGVAYFAGKSSAPKNEVSDNSNYFPTTEQNYAPPTTNNNPPAQTPPPTNNPPQETVSSVCSGITQPTIIVDHPVANQTFSISSPFNVKWHTCNIPATHKVYIGLMPVGEFQGAPPMIILSSSTPNDGTETFTLSNFGVSADTYTVFMKDNNLPNGTTNAWSGQFKITAPITTQAWSTLTANQTGVGQIIYPSNWVVTYMNGGSYGTANSVVGVVLKPSAGSPANDAISIGGWQYDCSNVNVSGGNNPATKAYCIQNINNSGVWSGAYITSGNQGSIYGSPMVTQSTNSQVLNMFDLIVQHNI